MKKDIVEALFSSALSIIFGVFLVVKAWNEYSGIKLEDGELFAILICLGFLSLISGVIAFHTSTLRSRIEKLEE